MGQKQFITSGLKIVQKSVFNLEELYKMMYRWFELRDYKFNEQEYKETDLGGGAKNIEIRWNAFKEKDDYVKFVIDPSFLIVALTKVEIEKEGLKVKTNQGEVEINIRAFLEKDYDNEWNKKPVRKMLREIYDKYVVGARIESYAGELKEDLYSLVNEIKAFLNLHRF